MKNGKAIIIGGGMAGITLALFLKKAGIPAVIYEAYPENKSAGGALTIAPNGMNVLHELGLA
jgi:2-polyprenyl-6-methoxyphenol hydroxylase-like FAD-dependent oxidoreductase